MLGGNAWHSWRQFASASRIADIADASGYTFKAMHNLRTDRTIAGRALDGDQPADPAALKRIEELRAAEMPALVSTLDILPEAEFDGKETLLPALRQQYDAMVALNGENWEALGKPKAERRAGLGDDYVAELTALLDTLDRNSTKLAAGVKLNNPFIDQKPDERRVGKFCVSTSS